MLTSKNRQGPVVIVTRPLQFAVPFGIGYLAGYLREKGEACVLLFKPFRVAFFANFADEIIALKPLVVGFGSLYPDLYDIQKLVRLLRQRGLGCPIVVGGQMVSPTPEFSTSVVDADYGVIGEGEIIFHELVQALREGRDSSSVKGLVIRADGQCINTGPGAYIEDLSTLPRIPYDLFAGQPWLEIGKYYARMTQLHWRYADRVVSIHGGRGCPYQCNFCYHHSRPRYRAIHDMMQEADELITRYDANMLSFGDDLVLASPLRASELVEAVPRLSRPVEYSVSCRFDILSRINDDLLRALKRSGCRIMGLGIESGSDRILKVMHKGITVEQIRSGLRRLKDTGILPTVSIMVGQDGETVDDVRQSLSLLEDIIAYNRNIQIAFTITTPFPGSPLYMKAIEKGLMKDDMDFFKLFDPAHQMGTVSLNMSSMTNAEVKGWRDRLESTFVRQSGLLRGRRTVAIDGCRRFLAFGDDLIRILRHASEAVMPPKLVRAMWRPYEWVYDRVQIFLDELRRK